MYKIKANFYRSEARPVTGRLGPKRSGSSPIRFSISILPIVYNIKMVDDEPFPLSSSYMVSRFTTLKSRGKPRTGGFT